MTIPIAGIDLSLTSTGVALIDDGIKLDRVRSKGTAKDSWDTRYTRGCTLIQRIVALIPPGAIVGLEGPAYSRNVGSAHDRAGLWWRLYAALREQDCELVVVSIQDRIRYALGKGSGDKDVVLASAITRYLPLGITLDGNDIADAMLIAALVARSRGVPLLGEKVTKLHLVAVDKIR